MKLYFLCICSTVVGLCTSTEKHVAKQDNRRPTLKKMFWVLQRWKRRGRVSLGINNEITRHCTRFPLCQLAGSKALLLTKQSRQVGQGDAQGQH